MFNEAKEGIITYEDGCFEYRVMGEVEVVVKQLKSMHVKTDLIQPTPIGTKSSLRNYGKQPQKYPNI